MARNVSNYYCVLIHTRKTFFRFPEFAILFAMYQSQCEHTVSTLLFLTPIDAALERCEEANRAADEAAERNRVDAGALVQMRGQ